MSVSAVSGEVFEARDQGVDRLTLGLVVLAGLAAACVLIGLVLPFTVDAPLGAVSILAAGPVPLGLVGVIVVGSAELLRSWRRSTAARRLVIGIALLLSCAAEGWALSPYGVVWLVD